MHSGVWMWHVDVVMVLLTGLCAGTLFGFITASVLWLHVFADRD